MPLYFDLSKEKKKPKNISAWQKKLQESWKQIQTVDIYVNITCSV
jgi:hypothetical protein